MWVLKALEQSTSESSGGGLRRERVGLASAFSLSLIIT